MLTDDLPQQNTRKQYTADGYTEIFAYTFLIPDNNSIAVYVTFAGNEPDPETDINILNVEYTVTGAGNDNGGTVVFIVPPADDSIVTLVRNVPYAVNTQFAESPITITGQNLDNAFLDQQLQIQQLATIQNDTCFKYAVNAITGEPSDFPAPSTYITYPTEVGQVPVWNGKTWISTLFTPEGINIDTALNAGFFIDGGFLSPRAAYIAIRNNNEPMPTILIDGTQITFQPGDTNGPNATLSIIGLVKPLLDIDGTVLNPGALLTNYRYIFSYSTSLSGWLSIGSHPADIVDGVLNDAYFVDGSTGAAPTTQYTAIRNNGEPYPTEIIDGTTILFQPHFTNSANSSLRIGAEGTTYPIVMRFSGELLPPGAWKGTEAVYAPRYQLTFDSTNSVWSMSENELLYAAGNYNGASQIGCLIDGSSSDVNTELNILNSEVENIIQRAFSLMKTSSAQMPFISTFLLTNQTNAGDIYLSVNLSLPAANTNRVLSISAFLPNCSGAVGARLMLSDGTTSTYLTSSSSGDATFPVSVTLQANFIAPATAGSYTATVYVGRLASGEPSITIGQADVTNIIPYGYISIASTN